MGNYYKGKIHEEMGNYEQAEMDFKKALALRPNFEAVLIELGLMYDKQKKTDAAIEILKDYLFLYPDRLNARIKLAELLLRAKRYDEAEREFNKILKVNRNNRDVQLTMGLLYLESGRYDMAIETFAELQKNYPSDKRFAYFLSSAYEEKKDLGKAVELLKTIPPSSELYGNARIRIGMILKKQDRLGEAIRLTEEAIAAKKEPGLYVFLSALQEENKDSAAAEKTLKEGLQAFPENSELHYAIGVVYEKTQRFEESVREMRTVLKVDPDNADALNFIGYSYADRGIRLDEAEKMILKALKLKPGSGYIIDSLGWLRYRQNKIAEALKYLKEASTIMPGDSAVVEHLGDAYLKAGQVAEALDTYRRALKLMPGNNALQKKIDDLQKK